MARKGAASGPSWEAFAAIAPGLEPVLVEELVELGVRAKAAAGGATFEADPAVLARVHAYSRCAGRVTLHVGNARATSLDELAAGIRALRWAELVWPRQPIDVRVTSHQSRLRRRDAVGKKVEHAIRDALRVPRLEGRRPARSTLGVLVRIEGDRAELRIDASGELLHKRGWRRDPGAAPLRENLASAVLRVAGWTPGEALIDPFCGSGTFPIEAALRAAGRPVADDRRFSWMELPCVPRVPGPGAPPPARATRIAGVDLAEDQVRAARANARRAGVDVSLEVGDARAIGPTAPTGLVVGNPPYGERLDGDLRGLYRDLGRNLAERFSGWRVALVLASPAHAKATGLPLERKVTFSNGGIRVGVYRGTIR